jgi:methionine-rich copper-binding protein CopC
VISRPSSVAAAVATVALAAAVLLGTASSAQAHNFLVSSTPAADEVVTELPETFSVTTNGPLLDLSGTGAGFAIQVTDAAGSFYGDGCLTVSGPTLSTPASLGEAGAYRLVWQVVSEDGHTVSGEFAFEWAPASDVEPGVGVPAPPVCGVDGADGPADPTGVATPGADATEDPVTVPEHTDATLADVLWIGVAILAVLGAAGMTLYVVGRRDRLNR